MIRIVYIFTTFPKKSEVFLQREILCLKKMNIDLRIYSILGGKKDFNGIYINKYSLFNLLKFPFNIIKSLFLHTSLFYLCLIKIFKTKPKSFINVLENLLGLAFGLDIYNKIKNYNPDIIHAPWATMPATAAIVISKLTKIPFSIGAHAYDIFENDGDMFLYDKIKYSKFIHTSTLMGKNKLLSISQKNNLNTPIYMIRRGLEKLPTIKKIRNIRKPLRIISIGRLVEKKGFLRQIEIYSFLKKMNLNFHAHIIGDGPMKKSLKNKISEYNLENNVILKNWMNEKKLFDEQEWSDIFIFTGKIAKNGDRDGLPNVIPECMARGIPIISSYISAVPEVIKSNINGILISNYNNNEEWYYAIKKLQNDNLLYEKLRNEAINWIHENYFGPTNTKKLINCFNEGIN